MSHRLSDETLQLLDRAQRAINDAVKTRQQSRELRLAAQQRRFVGQLEVYYRQRGLLNEVAA
jgi:hypothetical protein